MSLFVTSVLMVCYTRQKRIAGVPGHVLGAPSLLYGVRDGMEYYIECLIGIAVFAAIWIIVSIVIIIAISWTHKW